MKKTQMKTFIIDVSKLNERYFPKFVVNRDDDKLGEKKYVVVGIVEVVDSEFDHLGAHYTVCGDGSVMERIMTLEQIERAP